MKPGPRPDRVHGIEAGFLGLLVTAVAADEPTAKLLYTACEGDTIEASSVLFSGTDRFRLTAQEHIVRKVSDDAVLVVETNKRLIGYRVHTGAR